MKTSFPAIFRFLGFNTQGDCGPYTFYTSTDKGLVIYLRAPPKTPATRRQRAQRSQFVAAALLWDSLTHDERTDWATAATRARLRISGWNLFTFLVLTARRAPIHTVERQSRTLLTKPD